MCYFSRHPWSWKYFLSLSLSLSPTREEKKNIKNFMTIDEDEEEEEEEEEEQNRESGQECLKCWVAQFWHQIRRCSSKPNYICSLAFFAFVTDRWRRERKSFFDPQNFGSQREVKGFERSLSERGRGREYRLATSCVYRFFSSHYEGLKFYFRLQTQMISQIVGPASSRNFDMYFLIYDLLKFLALLTVSVSMCTCMCVCVYLNTNAAAIQPPHLLPPPPFGSIRENMERQMGTHVYGWCSSLSLSFHLYAVITLIDTLPSLWRFVICFNGYRCK